MARAAKGRKAPKSRLDDARERMYRELILESAEGVFGEKGFDGATMQDVAADAGISLKTLYASFASKKALVAEVQIMRARDFLEVCEEAIARGGTPIEQLSNGIHAYVAFLFDYQDWMKLQLRTRASWGLRPEGRDAVAMWRAGHASYATSIAEGIADGTFHPAPGVDPEELARLIQAIMQVAVAKAASDKNFDAPAVAGGICAHIWRLLGVADPEALQGPGALRESA